MPNEKELLQIGGHISPGWRARCVEDVITALESDNHNLYLQTDRDKRDYIVNGRAASTFGKVTVWTEGHESVDQGFDVSASEIFIERFS